MRRTVSTIDPRFLWMLLRTESSWQIWIDRGGRFTDCLALDPAGTRRRAKVLSSSALRAVVTEVESADALRVAEEWGAAASER